MPQKTKNPRVPAVASTGCTSLMSLFHHHRRAAQPHPSPRVSDNDGDAGAEQYWKRVQFLEEEIRRLSKWLGPEEERRASSAAAAERVVVRGGVAAAESVVGNNVTVAKKAKVAESVSTEGVKNNSAKADKQDESTSAGTDSTTAASSTKMSVVSSALLGMAKLGDGSYLREVARVGRPWERLAVQVSRPVIPEDAKSASEVLDKMAATMRPDDLSRFLSQMMPLKDISGRQTPAGEPVRRTARLSTGDDLLETLVFAAMDRMEALVLEGLKIQMASSSSSSTTAADHPRHEPVAVSNKNCMVHVVMVQVRDPKERFAAVGDPMIGIIEAALETKDGTVKIDMQGMHVAGIGFADRKSSSDGRCVMWSASLRRCKGPHRGDGCRCSCVRNPNRVFRH